MVFDERGTYVETDVEFSTTVSHEWNHGLGEIVTALLDARLEHHRLGRARQRAVGGPAGTDGADTEDDEWRLTEHASGCP